VTELDGEWDVRRGGGLLPPMKRVRKRIEGQAGFTQVGPVRLPFAVEGRSLRYRFPPGLVDELEPDGEGFRGRALFAGRTLGHFRLVRAGDTRET
jgi:hypothetical protein